MVLVGLGCDQGTAETFFAYQPYFVVGHPQMVNNSSFVLSFFPTPWAMGYPIEMMLVRSMTFGDSEWNNGQKNCNPFGMVLRV